MLSRDPALQNDLFAMLREVERRLDSLERGRGINAATIEGGALRVLDSNGDEIVVIGVYDDSGTAKVGIKVTDPAGPTILLEHSVNY